MFRILLWIAAAGCFGKLVHDVLNQPGQEGEVSSAPNEDTAEAPEEVHTCRAVVREAFRAMDPITLQARTAVVFVLPDDSTWKAFIQGEGGSHLLPGDEGLLERSGDVFLSFAKDSGEVIGAMYYVPAAPEEEE